MLRPSTILAAILAGLLPTVGALAAEKTVDFQADRVELDPESDTMHLEGDVSIVAERYRLTADDVRVRRTPQGVWVDGEGRVAFCPCPAPPVSLGFRRALVAPPTDLVLEQPTLRVGSVPVAWLPYVWLRSPRRFGLLPPKLAWRARDGLLAGLGAHVPLAGDASSVDIRAAGYVRGGVEVEARMYTPRTSTSVGFDHLDESMLAVDARGTVGDDGQSVIAWDLDAVRGRRVARGPIMLETAARRFDRARIGTTWVGGPTVLGIGVGADAERGGPLGTTGAVGPATHVSVGAPVGGVGTVHESAWLTTRHDDAAGALSSMAHAGQLSLDGRPSVFGMTTTAHTAALGVLEAGSQRGAAAAGVVGRVELPLVRRFGASIDHHVAPFAEVGGKLAATDPGLPWLHDDGGTLHAAAGVRTALGAYATRSGVAAAVRGGVVGPPERPRGAATARLTASAQPVGLASEIAWLPRDPESIIVLARGRLGRIDGPSLAPRVTGRSAGALTGVRVIEGGGWDATPVGWLDRAGWNAGGGASMPWTDWLATGADVDVDVTRGALLGVRGAAAYRHACGCLAVVAWAGHRRGRDGVDAMLTVDLAP